MAGEKRATNAGEGAGAPRGRNLLRVAVAVLGVVGAVSVLDRLWSPPDPGLSSEEQAGGRARLAEPPNRPITVLLIGSDANKIGAPVSGAAPPGPPNSDTLMLLRVDPAGALRVLQVPTEIAVKLPGQPGLLPLGALYRRGGVALTVDAVAELVGLALGQPERYVVVSRGALRELVDGLGGVELSPDRPMRYTDKAQNLTIDLQSGLQVLKGSQVEQMARFREPGLGEQGRRQRQQLVVSGLLAQLGRTDQLPRLPDEFARLAPQLDTNLSQAEALSLLAAALQKPETIRFDRVPLKPPIKPDQPLREIEASAPMPLWPRG
jgi:LCP family protein required for cell wall assembly